MSICRKNTHLADVGAGAGFPSLPCLIVREDLRGNLIESSGKKVVFLREAATRLNIHDRTTVLNVRFEDLPPPEFGVVTCRALDKFTEKLPEIAAWAEDAESMMLFGGASIRTELEKTRLAVCRKADSGFRAAFSLCSFATIISTLPEAIETYERMVI